jgi:hypothetical protein
VKRATTCVIFLLERTLTCGALTNERIAFTKNGEVSGMYLDYRGPSVWEDELRRNDLQSDAPSEGIAILQTSVDGSQPRRPHLTISNRLVNWPAMPTMSFRRNTSTHAVSQAAQTAASVSCSSVIPLMLMSQAGS